MQELMFRLIRDNKIVGYLKHDCNNIIGLFNTSINFNGFDGLIDYDSFELGINVGDSWWFSGDLLYDPLHNVTHELIYDGINGWKEMCKDYKSPIEVWVWLIERIDRIKVIGNIHENIQDARKFQDIENHTETEKVQPD